MAKPFLRWCGGKSKLVPEIQKRLPEEFGTYHEPFVGGGAVLFALAPQKARIYDANAELIFTYVYIKYQLDGLLKILDAWSNHLSEEDYLVCRAAEPTGLQAAARMIYLNKCGFNGLYRVNKKGKFNVPWGKRTNVSLYNRDNITACSEVLQNTEITDPHGFEDVLKYAEPGDAVYMDPPYAPVSKTADFTAYTAGGFSWADQVRVKEVAEELRSRGCHVVLSNAGIPEIKELYKDWRCDEVSMRRNINSDGTKRGTVGEFLIW